MNDAQKRQQAQAIEAVRARQKEDAKNPKTGGPAPEMPVVGGTPNVSPSDKAKYAAEIARKTPQIVPSTRRIQEQPQASTQSQANVMRDYYASRQRAAQAQPTPTKPIAPPVTPIAPKIITKPIAPPVTPIAPKIITDPVQPTPSTSTGPSTPMVPSMKRGGAVRSKPQTKFASGGSVGSASRRGDGIAQRGKTKGRMC